MSANVQPRLIRQSQAANYLGLSAPTFNKLVRPYVTVIHIDGGRAVWYDRLDLDAWADDHKQRYGRPPTGEAKCLNQHQVYGKEEKSGTLKKPYTASAFAEALEKRVSKRQSGT